MRCLFVFQRFIKFIKLYLYVGKKTYEKVTFYTLINKLCTRQNFRDEKSSARRTYGIFCPYTCKRGVIFVKAPKRRKILHSARHVCQKFANSGFSSFFFFCLLFFKLEQYVGKSINKAKQRPIKKSAASIVIQHQVFIPCFPSLFFISSPRLSKTRGYFPIFNTYKSAREKKV